MLVSAEEFHSMLEKSHVSCSKEIYIECESRKEKNSLTFPIF